MDVFSIALRFPVRGGSSDSCMMSLFGVQALVALCSSIPLAQRRKKQEPDFDLSMALGRIARLYGDRLSLYGGDLLCW